MKQSCGGQCESNAPTLVFACSGAADVGEITDRAARALSASGAAKMFCLAGIGGLVPDMVAKAREAGKLLVIDGCEKNCGFECLARAGLGDLTHIALNDMGMEKGKSPVTEEAVARVVQAARTALV